MAEAMAPYLDAASRPARQHLLLSLAFILAITGWRVLCLWLTPLDLFMDEAQYWLWGTEPALGYFSKPPLIGWVIGAVTTLSGGDTTFTVRLSAPMGHALAAVMIGFAARAYWSRDEAIWAGAAYASLPGVGVLSLFVSTDDLLMPACAAALWALIRLRQGAVSARWTVLLGAALGLGLLAKYAMLYVLIVVALQAIATQDRRLRNACLAALLLGLLIASPNLIWNIRAGFVTLGHTAQNAGWDGMAWNWPGLAEFLAIQFIAFGPVFATSYLPSLRHALRRHAWPLVALSIGIFITVGLQALIRGANGNWAAPAFIAATISTVPWCLSHWRRATLAGLMVNAAFCVILPATTLWPDRIHIGKSSVYARIEETTRLNRLVEDAARQESVAAIVSDDRMSLATLTWRLRNEEMGVYALPPQGIAQNHYEMTRPARSGLDHVLLIVSELPSGCDSARSVKVTALASLSGSRSSQRIYVANGDCWEQRNNSQL